MTPAKGQGNGPIHNLMDLITREEEEKFTEGSRLSALS